MRASPDWSALSSHLRLTVRRLSVMMLFFATLITIIVGWIVVGSLLDLWKLGL